MGLIQGRQPWELNQSPRYSGYKTLLTRFVRSFYILLVRISQCFRPQSKLSQRKPAPIAVVPPHPTPP